MKKKILTAAAAMLFMALSTPAFAQATKATAAKTVETEAVTPAVQATRTVAKDAKVKAIRSEGKEIRIKAKDARLKASLKGGKKGEVFNECDAKGTCVKNTQCPNAVRCAKDSAKCTGKAVRAHRTAQCAHKARKANAEK